MYTHLVRPLLFLLKPETVHALIVNLIKFFFAIPGIKYLSKSAFSYAHPKLKRNVFGIDFKNPVGLAAGFDKNAELYNHFDAFGFSFIEIGTVTPKPQPGNPKPRSFRLKADKALINRMGFNNKGVSNAKKMLENKRRNVVVGGNIGKNTATPNIDAVTDYLECFKELYPVVDYFVVNVSCPNIKDLKDLQDTDNLRAILGALTQHRQLQKIRKPILLKISPDLTIEMLDSNISIATEMGLDGFVATNTTTSRQNLATPEREIDSIGNGGLSGLPIKDRSTEVIRYIHDKTNGKMPIIGVGGIMTEKDALEKLAAGASLIQLYTGFIYQGPALAKRICKALVK
ncbi:MAG: quinone-dependent dihydroorotate dehydrogenase [Bacteroidales bacterium]